MVDLLFYGLVNLLRSCRARSTYRVEFNKYRVPIISQAILCETYLAGPEDQICDLLNTCRTAHSIYLVGPANWRGRGLFEQVPGNTKRWKTILDKNYLSYPRKKRPHGRAVSAPDFGIRGRGFDSRWRRDLLEPKRHFIAQSLSCSAFHHLEMTEILLKGPKTLTCPKRIQKLSDRLCKNMWSYNTSGRDKDSEG